MFIGFVIKNQFHYNALQCNNHCEDRAHLYGNEGTMVPIFLRGMFIEPSLMANRIIEKINKISSMSTLKIFQKYAKLLSQFNLTCNNTYAYLADGIYPIDTIHLNRLGLNDKLSYNDYSKKVLNLDKLPWYFTPEIKALILTKSNTYIYNHT